MFPGGAALLLATVVVLIVVVAALAWAVIRRSARIWSAIAPRVARARSWLVGSTPLVRLRRRYPRALAFIADRLSLTGYLGLHLTLGLALSLAALVAFSHLASEVVLEQEFREFDAVAATVAELLRSPAGDRLFVLVTTLGEPLTWAILSAMIVLALALRREWMLAIGWIVAILGSGAADLTLKVLFQRPRPAGATEFIVGHSWSFPSGHAMGSLVGYGMLAYILILHVRRPAARFAIATGALILTVAIGVSRIYLGVHYFTDVIAGYFAGVLWLSVCVTAMELVRRRVPTSARTSD